MTGYIYLRYRDGELSYVGSTCRPNNRYNTPFCLQILEVIERPTHHKLISRERYWMSYLIKIHGLKLSNKMQPASFGGTLTFTHTKETRDKISRHNGNHQPGARERLSKAARKVWLRPGYRQKVKIAVSKALRQAWARDEVKQNHAIAMTPEVKQKISISVRRAMTSEVRKKISKHNGA